MTHLAAATFCGTFNLQTTLAAASAQLPPPAGPHHPISCPATLRLEADGALTCDHARVPPDDPRTQACLDQSIAILLIELLREREDADAAG